MSVQVILDNAINICCVMEENLQTSLMPTNQAFFLDERQQFRIVLNGHEAFDGSWC